MGRAYKVSPTGIARHAWVNKPDIKFNADGLYHTDLVLEGPDAEKFRAEVKALSDEGFENELKLMEEDPKKQAALRKKWTVYYPYEEETDEENGNPTGRVIFKFKQNALIRLKDGSTKKFKLGLRDGNNKATDTAVVGGSTIRVMWSARDVKLASSLKAGVRLDFSMVQLLKPADRKGPGFDEVEGAYVDEGHDGGTDQPAGTAPKDDY